MVDDGGGPDGPRLERLARNELLFREVNERLRELGEGFSLVAEHGSFVCECSDTGCTEPVEITLEQYRRVRSDERHFVLVAGHARPELEHVVYALPPYVVVAKREDVLEEAEETAAS
jgi:hypothetical protein